MAWTERYVDASAAGSGDGTTTATSGANGAFTLAEAITHSTTNTGIRYNVKAGTYANTTNTRTFSGVGTTTAPNWWRGYKSAIGDMDTEPTTSRVDGTDIPLFSFTAGRAVFSGAHQIVSNISFISANTANPTLSVSGAFCHIDRVRSENTNAAASSRAAASATGAGITFSRCWFKATSTATGVFNIGITTLISDCAFVGGLHGVDNVSAASIILDRGVFLNQSGDCIHANSTSVLLVGGCTFYNPGSDGIEIATAAPVATSIIHNCVFANIGSNIGINNSSGTNTNTIHRYGNLYYSCTTPESGFGDSPSLAQLADSASPFVNAAGGDLTLIPTSNGYAAPFLLENLSLSSSLDKGAVQHRGVGFSPLGGGLIGVV